MEHGDNYLQNAQNLMDNLQIASGGDVIGGGGGVVGSGGLVGCGSGNDVGGFVGGAGEEIMFGKCDEEQHDEDELKYIKEVQQSEKQQQQHSLLHDDDAFADDVHHQRGVVVGGGVGIVDGGILVGNGNGNGNGNAGHNEYGYDDGCLLDDDEEDYNDGKRFMAGNGDVNVNIAITKNTRTVDVDFGIDGDGNNVANVIAAYEDDEVDVIKNDGDFSTTSTTTTSTAGEDAAAGIGLGIGSGVGADDLLQVNAPLAAEQQKLPEETEDEEPSSLATNGTSSLSENPPPPQQHQEQQQLELELHSELNPDAKEFVPHFGSNLGSPVSPFPSGAGENVIDFAAATAAVSAASEFAVGDDLDADEGLVLEEQQQLSPHPSALPRHLLDERNDDDFVAQSPRKGRGADMDAISLPPENEFEHEVAKRPHELEQEDDMISEQQQDVANGDAVNNAGANPFDDANETTEGAKDTPASFIDHGPETSVDLEPLQPETAAAGPDAQAHAMNDDIMKQSIYVDNIVGESIEELLNTVQPLPTESDSLNNSFVEREQENDGAQSEKDQLESQPEPQQQPHALSDEAFDTQLADFMEKELLHVEEKEHVSHSPSTEEMQVELQAANELHSSAKDISQLPIDPMQESFYLEHTSAEAQQQQQEQAQPEYNENYKSSEMHNLLMEETNNPFECNMTNNTSYGLTDVSSFEAYMPVDAPQAPTEEAVFHADMDADTDITPSPLSSTEIEKHMMEETKEQPPHQQPIEEVAAVAAVANDTIDDLAQKMDNLLLSNADGNLSQVEDVAAIATTIAYNNETINNYAPLSPTAVSEKAEEAEADEPQQQQQHVADTEAATTQLLFNEEVKEELVEEQHAAATPAAEVEEEEEDKYEQHDEIQIPREATEVKAADSTTIIAQPTAVADISIDQPSPVAVEKQLAELEAHPEPVADAAVAVEAAPVAAAAVDEPVADLTAAAAAGAVTAAAAIGAAVAVVAPAAAASKKSTATSTAKKPAVSPAGAKSSAAATKPGSAKKPAVEPAAKKTSATTSATARPAATATKSTTTTKPIAAVTARQRTAPVKAAATTGVAAEKKPLTARSTPATTTTAARKPLSSAATASARPATASARGATTTAAAARPATASSTTARRSLANGSAATAPKTSAAARPAAPTKPTTLGLTSTTTSTSASAAKPKPRVPLTSQLRKTASPANGVAKSPSKAPAAPTTNGLAAKTTRTTTTTTTTVTKTFTARPAPKSTATAPLSGSSSARRNTTGGTTTTRTTTTTTAAAAKPSATALRKTASPLKPTAGKLTSSTTTTTTKTTTSSLKAKTPIKPAAGSKPTTPSSSALKQKAALKANGTVPDEAAKKLLLDVVGEESSPPQPQLNGGATENGHGEVQHNGVDGSGLSHADDAFMPEQVAVVQEALSLLDA